MPIYEEKEKINGQKRYYIRTYVIGSTGKKIQKEKHNKLWLGIDGKREAQKQENIMRYSYQNSSITLDELKESYFESIIDTLKPSTYEKYKTDYEYHISKFLGKRDIYSLTTKDILDFKKELEIEKIYNRDKLLSLKSKKAIFFILSAILKYGCVYYNLEKNVASIVGNFKMSKGSVTKEIQFLTEEEFNEFIKYEENPIYRDFFTTLFYTGMRRGELLALRYEDIKDNYICINKSLNPKNGQIATVPKTDKSNRKILMLDEVKSILLKHKKGIIFGLDNIKLMTLCRKCNNNLLLAGINKKIRIHDFRHSFASLCINNNVPIKTFSEYLGHENVSTTMNIYSHLYPNSQEIMIDILKKRKK